MAGVPLVPLVVLVSYTGGPPSPSCISYIIKESRGGGVSPLLSNGGGFLIPFPWVGPLVLGPLSYIIY